MATKYTVLVPNGELGVRARKDAAIALGEKSGQPFQVVTDSGKVVHNSLEQAAPADEDLIGSPAEEQPADAGDAEESGESAEEEVAADEVANAKVGSTHFDIAKMKKKIAKMLAKAERTDNDHERETFTAAAERMMIRLGIAAAELEAEGEVKPEEIVEKTHVFSGIYATTMVGFTYDLAQGFGNITILQSSVGQRKRVVYVIGHKSDVEQFMTLLASLNLQGLSALKRFQRDEAEQRAWRSSQEKFVMDRSFLSGFASEVRRRLEALRIETEAEATTGAALVLAGKQARIDEHMAEAYPNLGKSRGGNRQYSSLSAAAGRAAGRTANIGGKSVGGKRGELS